MVHATRSGARRSLLGPLILIALGVLLLLTNLGWIPWDFWRTAWRLWPVLLILLGLELLVSGRASWGSVLFALLVLAALGLASSAAAFFSWVDLASEAAPVADGQTFEQPLEGASSAEVQVEFGAGRVEIGPGAREGLLAEGVVRTRQDTPPSTRYRVRNGVGSLSIGLTRDLGFLTWLRGNAAPGHLSLRLSTAVPIQRLEVTAGAVDGQLDLRELQLRELELELGASRGLVRLPARGRVNASLKAGASSLVVEIPSNMAARIRVEGGATGLQVDTSRFPPTRVEGIPGLGFEREYRSPGYDSAADRVELRISAGAASVEIR